MRILVVEDDTPTAQAIATLLTGQNYAVEIASDRLSALELLDAFPFDLILLDVVMPDGDGIELCRKVRADGHQMPILMVTGRDSGHDKALGLDAGADDYVVKPFDPEELSARIRALLRRGSVAGQPVLEWGPLRLDPSSCDVSFGEQALTLTPKEYALLELFLRNSRRVFSCGVILEQIWSFEEMPGEEAVRTHIKGLRQKLKAKGAPADFVETVYGIGYRLKPLEAAENPIDAEKPSEAVQQQTLEAIAQLWQKFKGPIQNQVKVVEEAVAACLNGGLDDASRQQATQEAHTLAGSLGTFGFPEASKHARTLEHWLQDKTPRAARKAAQMAELVRAIQHDIKQPHAPAPQSPRAPAPTSTPPAQEHLMVVDDDPAMLETVKVLLEPWGLNVTTLSDPRQFWETLEAATPNLLILDIQMPYRSGIELCQEVREHDRWGGLPIMILTAHQDAETVNQVFAAGADDFVSKPIVGPELVSRILHRLERVRLWRRFNAAPVQPEPKTQRRHSEEQFHQLVDGIKDYAIYMLDTNGHIISWNTGAQRIKGYSPTVVLGQYLGRLYLPEEVTAGKPEQDLAIARTEGRCEFLGWRQRQDGTCFWGDVVITSVWNPDQTLRGYAVVTRDVTDRKQMDEALQRSRDKLEVRVAERTAELVGVNERLRRELEERKRAQEALRVSQARFAGILDIADDAIISVDASQRITLFNQGAEKIFGYTAQDVRDQSLAVLLPDRYASAHRGYVQDFGKAHNNARRMGERREIYGRRKDGSEFPAEASISKFEVGGEVVYTVILRDITSRKQAEEALATLSHENELILNSVGEGICGLDLQGRITFMNPAATHLLGYTRDELIGQSMQIILENAQQSADDTLGEPSTLDVLLHNGATQQAKRNTFWRKDGTTIPVEYISTPIQEQSEIVGSVITFKDITERQVVERMKDEFISVVSHELRTPLTSIHGSLGMLASGLLAADPTTSKRLLDIAVASTERLVRLINDILDVERIESGKVTMQLQPCDARELVHRAVDALQPMAEKSGITLQVQAESTCFQADPDRILQTLTNLLSNAIKFSPPNSNVWIAATLDQGSELQPDAPGTPAEGPFAAILQSGAHLLSSPHVLFSVADQGRGIPLDKRETIFERFQQVDASDSRNQDGTGLGLAICRNIVQQHGGRIFVESVLGKGSTFYFTIPLRSPNESPNEEDLPLNPS